MNLARSTPGPPTEAREAFLRCCGSTPLVRADGERSGRSNPRRRCSKPPSESGGASTAPIGSKPSRPTRRIGDLDALRAKFAATAAWATREQAGVAGASEDVLRELAGKPPI